MTTQPNATAFPSERFDGLTKREYFAAMAMQGLLNYGDKPDYEDAAFAVRAADNLIEELNQTKEK